MKNRTKWTGPVLAAEGEEVHHDKCRHSRQTQCGRTFVRGEEKKVGVVRIYTDME